MKAAEGKIGSFGQGIVAARDSKGGDNMSAEV
jgi:hypothetical protein